MRADKEFRDRNLQIHARYVFVTAAAYVSVNSRMLLISKREAEGRSPIYGRTRRDINLENEAGVFSCDGVWGPSLSVPTADVVGEFRRREEGKLGQVR